MKRIFAALLILVLLACDLPALAEPSSAAITVDGVRTAFFDENGVYLPPVEKNGLVYVPVKSLSDSLQLDVTADADTLAVTINGVRTAFFDETGAYLPPVNVDGVVYVPLIAFAQSAGLGCVVDGGTYALTRSEGGVTAKDEPAPAPTQAPPDYVWVDLTMANFNTYFNCEIWTGGFYSWETKYNSIRFQHWSENVTLKCTARTPYEYKNISFNVYVPASSWAASSYGGKGVSFTDVVMPQSGEYSQATKLECLYIGYYSPTSIKGHEFGSFTISQVKGSIRIPRADMMPRWKAQYDTAMAQLNNKEFLPAVAALKYLADNQYEDSDKQLIAAQEAQYDYALEALQNGDGDTAVAQFADLNRFGYRDAAQKLKEAQEVQRSSWYQQADASEANGDFSNAEKLFKRLMDLGYQDSADRYQKARAERQEQDYQAAKEDLENKKYASALSAFEILAKEDYLDSKALVESTKPLKAVDDAKAQIKRSNYSDAKTTLEPYISKNATAASLYAKCRFRLAESVTVPNKAGNVWVRYGKDDTVYTLISSKGKALRKDIASADQKRYDDSGKLIVKSKYSMLTSFNGNYALVKRGSKYCLLDKTGKEKVLPGKYNYINMASSSLVCFQDKKTHLHGCMNVKGKIVIKAKYKNPIYFGNGFANVTDKNWVGYRINTKGKRINIKGYSYVRPLSSSLILVANYKSGKYRVGFLNGSGKVLKKPGFYVSNSYWNFNQYGKYLIVEKNGKECITDLKFKAVVKLKNWDITMIVNGKCFIAKTNGNYALYSMKGKNLTSNRKYTAMNASADSKYIAAKGADGFWYLLDQKGSIVY